MCERNAAVFIAAVFATLGLWGAPVVNGTGVVNNASYTSVPGIARGSIFAVFGEDLGPQGLQVATSFPLATRLGGTAVRLNVGGVQVNGLMLYVSPSQIGAVLPSSTPAGEGSLEVSFNGQTSAPVGVRVVDRAPGLFAANQQGTGPGAVTDERYALISRERPARPGETVILWATGLGPVTGDEAGGPLPGELPGIGVTIGGQSATVLYAGRSGCCAGLDQIHVVVPPVAAGCDVPVVLTAGGVASNAVTLAAAPPGTSCDQGQPPASAQITINPAVRHQVMGDWEATAQAGDEIAGYPGWVNHLIQAAYDAGISRLRVEFRSGVESPVDYWSQYKQGQISSALWRCYRYSTINDNSDAFSINWAGFQFSELDHKMRTLVIPMRDYYSARGKKLAINLNYVAFVAQISGSGCPSGLSYLHDDNPEEYAEVVEAAFLHLQQRWGVTPDYFEFLLEPGSPWNPTMLARAAVAAAARLRSRGFTTVKFIAPSHTDMGNSWIWWDQMMQVSGFRGLVSELSYHRYGGVSDANLQAIATRAQQNNIVSAMLEHIGSGHADLYDDIVKGYAGSWQQYTLAFSGADDGGKYFIIDPAANQVRPGSRTTFLRQYFKYVLRGAQRIGAVTDNQNFRPTAYINPGGSYVVVIHSLSAGSVAVNGLPPGTYGITYTTSQQAGMAAPDAVVGAGQPLRASIPGAGVITIYGK